MVRIKVLSVLILISFLGGQEVFCQQDARNQRSQNENVNQLTRSIFKYPKFVAGEIVLKDSSKIHKKLNYNRVLGKILFEDRIGQSRDLENPETIDKILIDQDTFCFRNNMYLEKITHFNKVNLYVNQTISYLSKDKNIAGGIPVIVSTNGSKAGYVNDDAKQETGFDQNSSFNLSTAYFLIDSSSITYPASKKSFYDVFPSLKDKLKQYLHDHSVNFSNAVEMKNLLQYLQGT